MTTQSIRQAIAVQLITYRKQHELTQKQMAKKLGIKKCTYAAYEEHRAVPSIITALCICEVLSISIYQLVKVN